MLSGNLLARTGTLCFFFLMSSFALTCSKSELSSSDSKDTSSQGSDSGDSGDFESSASPTNVSGSYLVSTCAPQNPKIAAKSLPKELRVSGDDVVVQCAYDRSEGGTLKGRILAAKIRFDGANGAKAAKTAVHHKNPKGEAITSLVVSQQDWSATSRVVFSSMKWVDNEKKELFSSKDEHLPRVKQQGERFGLNGRYYQIDTALLQMPDLDKLTPLGDAVWPADQIPFKDPDPSDPSDYFPNVPQKYSRSFGLRFDGYLQIPKEGEYKFTVRADNAAKVFIDGKKELDIDYDLIVGFSVAEGEVIRLKAGAHPIVIHYANVLDESYGLELMWTPPGEKGSVLIPFTQFTKKP